jgi:hypothetical protein
MRCRNGGAAVAAPQNAANVLIGAPIGNFHLEVAAPEVGALLVRREALARQTPVLQMVMADNGLGRIPEAIALPTFTKNQNTKRILSDYKIDLAQIVV